MEFLRIFVTTLCRRWFSVPKPAEELRDVISGAAARDFRRIPERCVYRKGAGAYGYFEVTEDITDLCAARLFGRLGRRTPVVARFSTFMGESGSPDSVRDVRGFAVKFYCDDGVWNLVGHNSPVFFIRDPVLYSSLVQSQSRNSFTHLKDPNMFWDFLTLHPESTHQVMIQYSDRGIPDGFRHMNGYGSNTYKLVNDLGEPLYCKFHWKTEQGVQNLEQRQAVRLAGEDPDYSIRDLYGAILNENFPSWTLNIQVMTFAQAEMVEFNPFDVTKVWPQQNFPLIPVGRMILDRIPGNYSEEIEQLSMDPSEMVPGIEPSPDRMLQCRISNSYSEAAIRRLGSNYDQIPVNCSSYIDPNAFCDPEPCSRSQSLPISSGNVYRYETGLDDNFSQAAQFYRQVLDEGARERLVENIVAHLALTATFIQERAVTNFSQVDADFGRRISEALALHGLVS
ncbi:catalase-like [Uranotaenia lowii]|uniref:catalase-like n=1 Tax=Uranotaenia lowii TaxID=190385 RepID=UPI00247ADB10|nr:catalase-like [Uranotaenia lowii]